MNYARQIRVVKYVCIANALVWDQLKIFSAEGMALSGGEVGERHLEAAAHLRIHVVNLARKSVWGKPLAHGVCIKESPIDSFWCSAQDAVKSDGVCCHGKLSFRVISLL
jgi:hypothetical protein